MKKILLLTLIMLVSNAYTQVDYTQFVKDGVLELKYQVRKKDPITEVNIPLNGANEIVYQRVCSLENRSALEIYDKARIVLTDMYNSIKDVKQLEDSNNKVIVLSGTERYGMKENIYASIKFDINYTMKIECRDGRYKVSLYNINTRWVYGAYGTGAPVVENISTQSALARGIKDDGYINDRLIEGMSLFAWNELGNKCLTAIENLMDKESMNTSNEW